MWYSDSVALARWQDIWLDEGFATYAEWLWSDHVGQGTPEEIFGWYTDPVDGIPPDDPFWELAIGDPGPDALFWWPVYVRGALTLQALRQQVGDDAFIDIIETWATDHADGNVTTPEFIALAEQVSGQQLDICSRPGCRPATRCPSSPRRAGCPRRRRRSHSPPHRPSSAASTSATASHTPCGSPPERGEIFGHLPADEPMAPGSSPGPSFNCARMDASAPTVSSGRTPRHPSRTRRWDRP